MVFQGARRAGGWLLKTLALVLVMLALLCGAALAEEDVSTLLVVTGAYYDVAGDVKVTARPARVELPQGAGGDEYILVEGAEETFGLRQDAYLAVPAELPVYEVRLQQAAPEEFPIYLTDFIARMDSTGYGEEPPSKGDGIAYRVYSLLYSAAVSKGEIASMTFCELPPALNADPN